MFGLLILGKKDIIMIFLEKSDAKQNKTKSENSRNKWNE